LGFSFIDIDFFLNEVKLKKNWEESDCSCPFLPNFSKFQFMMEELLTLCAQTCEAISHKNFSGPLHEHVFKDPWLQRQIEAIDGRLDTWMEVHHPAPSSQLIDSSRPLKAVAWNIERGKNFEGVLEVLQGHPEISEADLYFLTEVDWGMARSQNRNVTEELAKTLGLHAYFAPSYYNLTQGHSSEKKVKNPNLLGLHGKAILSRFPLENLRVVPMPNATDKLHSKESRIGQKRALLGDLKVGEKKLSLACVHLDAFSSPESRTHQLLQVVKACETVPYALLAGDWNTNTLNTTSSVKVFLSILRQLLITRPRKTIQEHHPYPDRLYDRRLFDMLKKHDFVIDDFNEAGAGTFDLVTNDVDMKQMVEEQYPRWLLQQVRRLIEKSGGRLSLKIDWFAGKNLIAKDRKVVCLKRGADYQNTRRPSDHHPIWVSFSV
jgi:endonuclease/exonuclease/phosphatase family metal-dependent hydrolase